MDEGGKKPDRRDVDAIWQQLNASRPGNKQAFDRLWHGFSSDVSRPGKPCSSSTLDTTKKRTQQLKLDPLLGKIAAARKEPASAVVQTQARTTGLEDAAVERLVQALQSPDGGVRKAALQQVQVGLACTVCCSFLFIICIFFLLLVQPAVATGCCKADFGFFSKSEWKPYCACKKEHMQLHVRFCSAGCVFEWSSTTISRGSGRGPFLQVGKSAAASV
jgi:hypothetical protein